MWELKQRVGAEDWGKSPYYVSPYSASKHMVGTRGPFVLLHLSLLDQKANCLSGNSSSGPTSRTMHRARHQA